MWHVSMMIITGTAIDVFQHTNQPVVAPLYLVSTATLSE
jgi:hypothetical protein